MKATLHELLRFVNIQLNHFVFVMDFIPNVLGGPLFQIDWLIRYSLRIRIRMVVYLIPCHPSGKKQSKSEIFFSQRLVAKIFYLCRNFMTAGCPGSLWICFCSCSKQKLAGNCKIRKLQVYIERMLVIQFIFKMFQKCAVLLSYCLFNVSCHNFTLSFIERHYVS